MKPMIFPLLLLMFFFAIHYLAYTRIIRRLHIHRAVRKGLILGLVINYFGIVIYIGSRYFFEIPSAIYFLASLSIAVGFLLFVGWILYELLHLIQYSIPFDPHRRRLFKIASDGIYIGLGTGYLGTGFFNDETTPRIVRVRIDQGHFDKSIRIAQISDLHIGGLIGPSFVRKIVEMINRESVDLVAITGDLLDTSIRRSRPIIEELLNLQSLYGTFYVVGNHEYFHGIDEILSYLKSTDITVLENSSKDLGPFTVVGLYDHIGKRYGSYRPDPDRAFAGIPPGKPTLLLMHQPKAIGELGTHRPSLILSGHTHGGQIWPFGTLVRLVQPYLAGLHRMGEKHAIYVNRGVGFWGPPMRIGAPAEITILEWN